MSSPFKFVFYLSPLLISNVAYLFVGECSNKLNMDFELYGSTREMIAGSLRWNFCNYDDSNIGFPHYCPPSGNSLTHSRGQKDYAELEFYALNLHHCHFHSKKPVIKPFVLALQAPKQLARRDQE